MPPKKNTKKGKANAPAAAPAAKPVVPVEEDLEDDDEEEEVDQGPVKGKHSDGSSAMTNMDAEGAEAIDDDKAKAAVSGLGAAGESRKQANEDDVQAIIDHLEVPRPLAVKALKDANNDLKQAMTVLIRA